MRTIHDLDSIKILYRKDDGNPIDKNCDGYWFDQYGLKIDLVEVQRMWLQGLLVTGDYNKTYDDKGNAKHYTNTRIATINKIEQIWGTMGARLFCEMTAFKYRDRIGDKDSVDQEVKKIKWYEEAAKVLGEKENSRSNVEGLPFDQEFIFKL